jgi:hypothetical protein
MIAVSSIMDSLLEEQRSVIKILVAKGENPCHIFKRLKKDFLINVYHVQPFTTGFLSFVKAEQVFVTGLGLGGQLSGDPNNGSKC